MTNKSPHNSLVMSDNSKWHGTTIVLIRKGKDVVVAGDGQVSLGNTVKKSTAKNPTIIDEIAPFSVKPFQKSERIIVGQKLAAIPWNPTRTNQKIVLSGVDIATIIATVNAIEAIIKVVNLEIPIKSFICVFGLIIFW